MKTKLNLKLNFLLAWMLILSCNPSDSDSKILITGILSDHYYDAMDVRSNHSTNDSNHVAIFVANYQRSAITDAEVSISSDSQDVSLEAVQEDELTIYKDIQERLRITPGKVYQLRVVLSNKRIFTARTKIPATPVIQSPANNDTLEAGTGYVLGQHDFGIIPLKINLDPSSRVKFYEYKFYYGPTQIVVHRYAMRQPDSVYFAINNEPSFNLKTDVLTLDSALFKYSFRLSKYPFGADSLYSLFFEQYSSKAIENISNIEGEGGVGCFGSYTSTSVGVYVKQ